MGAGIVRILKLHDHDDGHDHHHHQPADQVTAAEMLFIQRDMKERIEQISYRIKK